MISKPKEQGKFLSQCSLRLFQRPLRENQLNAEDAENFAERAEKILEVRPKLRLPTA
jgi:hypothetical protein